MKYSEDFGSSFFSESICPMKSKDNIFTNNQSTGFIETLTRKKLTSRGLSLEIKSFMCCVNRLYISSAARFRVYFTRSTASMTTNESSSVRCNEIAAARGITSNETGASSRCFTDKDSTIYSVDGHNKKQYSDECFHGDLLLDAGI